MTPRNMPGFGDPETWGPCLGHGGDPRTEMPDDWLDEDAAYEAARDDIDATPSAVAGWLREECAADYLPLDAYDLARKLMAGQRALSVPELVAVLMSAPAPEAVKALYALRDKYHDATAHDVLVGAADMLAEQARAAQAAADADAEDAYWSAR